MAERSETSNLKDKLVAEMRSLSSRAMDKGKLAAGKAKSTARNILASKACKGFRDFILRGNVVSLAVAVVVGTAFTALVDAFVADWITPLIAVIFQGGSFADLTFDINDSVFAYGHFINTLLTFLIICCILYFFVILPMNTLVEIYFPEHLQKDPEYRECPTCFKWEVDVRASKCPFCCTELVPLPGKKTPILLQEVLIEGEEIKVGFAENEAFEK